MPQFTSAHRSALRRTVIGCRKLTGLPVVFAGPVGSAGVVLNEASGMRTGALDGLLVARDSGLGGRAVQLGRPVSVHDYSAAETISHDYDRQVNAEGLVSLVAIPVSTERGARAVLYGALRRRGPMGDRAVGQLCDAASALARELARRDDELEAPDPGAPTAEPTDSRGDLRSLVAEAYELATRIDDPRLSTEIVSACRRLQEASRPPGRHTAGPSLSPRELDVLGLASAGCRNEEIADMLTMSTTSVKAQLRSTMRKFGVHSRHAAVSAARANGLMQ
jgi:DNA-binding CsgD family transcriptional regulator